MVLPRIVVASRQTEVQQLARRVGQEVFVADDLSETLDIVRTVNPDLVLFDHLFSPGDIRDFINEIRGTSMHTPVVIVGDSQDAARCAELIRIGAYDYVKGKSDHNRLEQIANRIKNKGLVSSEPNANDFFVDDHAASVSMVGRSRAFAKTLGMIRLVAASRCNPVLIVGETGTGKELAARAIHAIRHPNERFVAVNCAALTANLLESELFGHEKGSFTGAEREKMGLLELAGSGTVLLDEISEMPIDLQTKLLRVLQEKTFRKVGGVKDVNCNATIIATSNRNLYTETKSKRFRRDLYYRLNICPVIIAPLKSPDRRADIPLLAEYFLRTSTICPEKSPPIASLTNLAVEALERHDWPGNVRELHNVIDRAILLETTSKIGLSSIIIDPAESNEESSSSSSGLLKDFSLAKAERELIARALHETGWQKTQAATLLGITRATLYAKVKQYNIEKVSHVSEESQNEARASSLSHPVSAPI